MEFKTMLLQHNNMVAVTVRPQTEAGEKGVPAFRAEAGIAREACKGIPLVMYYKVLLC